MASEGTALISPRGAHQRSWLSSAHCVCLNPERRKQSFALTTFPTPRVAADTKVWCHCSAGRELLPFEVPIGKPPARARKCRSVACRAVLWREMEEKWGNTAPIQCDTGGRL